VSIFIVCNKREEEEKKTREKEERCWKEMNRWINARTEKTSTSLPTNTQKGKRKKRREKKGEEQKACQNDKQ